MLEIKKDEVAVSVSLPRLVNQLFLLLACTFGAGYAWALPWWNCDWNYRTEMSNGSTVAGNQQTVQFEVSGADFYSAYTMTPDGSDLRVVDADNSTLLDFYLAHWDPNTGTAVLNVRFPSITSTPSEFYRSD